MATTIDSSAETTTPPKKTNKVNGVNIVRRVPWIWVLPALLLLVAFRYAPMVAGAGYAFTDWDGINPSSNFIGFENFIEIWNDPLSRVALLNSVGFAVAFVIVANVLGLALAIGLSGALKTGNFLRAAFFAPVVMSPLATAFVWRFIFQANGPLNKFLESIGLDFVTRTWLADPTFARVTIFVVMVWQFTGLTMVVYLAGLQGISQEIQEAAEVDGATPWMKLRKITLPLLAPAVTIALTLSVIYGLGVFDQVVALTGGGPSDSTETLATQVYKQTFSFGRFGYGTALALVLTVLITLVSVVQLTVLRRREERI